MCVCVCVCMGGGGVGVWCIAATGGRVGGMGVCVWRPPVGAGAETEAERHSQAKDNAVCVLPSPPALNPSQHQSPMSQLFT